MTLKTTISRIAANLAELGINSGDLLMVHSSYKSLGPVEGGIETVILGFLQAIGPEGTLLFPALNWTIQPGDIFDPKLTPTIVGAIPEYFRTRPDVTRSIHPTHSACGIGANVNDILGKHYLDRSPCGEHSPFRILTQLGGKIVMLGCGLRPNTTMHSLEELVVPAYLFGGERSYQIRQSDGGVAEFIYQTHGFQGWEQRYDRVANLDSKHFLRTGRVLLAETHILDASRLRQSVISRLEQDPLYFVDRVGV